MPTGIYKRKERVPIIIRLESKTITIPECGCMIFMGSSSPDGYGRIRFKGKWINAHRVAWELYNGPIPEGVHVLHHCDTPSCINRHHLFLGTNFDNVQDKMKKKRGKNACGERQGLSKLTTSQVIEIRESSDINSRLAIKHGVSATTITQIKKRRTWKHIPGVVAKSRTV